MANAFGDVTKFGTAGIGASLVDTFAVQPLLSMTGMSGMQDVGMILAGTVGRGFFKNKFIKNAFESEAIVGSFLLGKRLFSGMNLGTTATTTNGKLF